MFFTCSAVTHQSRIQLPLTKKEWSQTKALPKHVPCWFCPTFTYCKINLIPSPPTSEQVFLFQTSTPLLIMLHLINVIQTFSHYDLTAEVLKMRIHVPRKSFSPPWFNNSLLRDFDKALLISMVNVFWKFLTPLKSLKRQWGRNRWMWNSRRSEFGKHFCP